MTYTPPVLSNSPGIAPRGHRLVLFLVMLVLGWPAFASDDTVFMIGNSLTWDTLPEQVDGAEWNVFCGKNLQYISENPSGFCVPTSSAWDTALNASSYDYVTVQPFPGTTLSQDVAIISAWMTLQPGAVFILHTGWGGHDDHVTKYESSDTSTMTPSAAYFDALEQQLAALHPGQTIRRTRAAEVLYDIALDIENGDAPFAELSELYRDEIHMSYGNGRYLMNNLMRLALDQDYVLTPEDQANEKRQYLNSKLVALVPEPASLCLLLAGAPLVLRRARRGCPAA